MARPERPVDPEAGPVQRLAHELRELRRAAGGPSYRTMAREAGFSATTLSQAAAGERLPSLAVVQGYVRACGGDPGEWEPRWKEAEAAAALREEETDAAPPYRGLARFEHDDRHLFFGRDRMVEELGRLVCDHRLAVLFGPSGSGKSSLLRAGLIPRLREEIARRSQPAVLRVLTPGARPARTYGPLLTPAEGEPTSWVVVDQFEEVFTLCHDRAERARFIDLLLAAREPAGRLRVLVTVRADFYARCAEHRGLADALAGAGLLLGPMTADELRETVTRPAAAAGLLVERELTTRVVEEVVDQPGALPMLSHALLETWRRRRGRMLTVAAYEAAGGVRGAIAATAEQAYGDLSAAQAATARRVLLRMVEPGRGATPDTRRPLTRAELDEWADPAVPVVVERLAAARLLTVAEDDVQLAHEALLTCWPRLAGWLEEDRERLRHHRRLTEAARVWLEHDRDPGALYRGSRLAQAEELLADDRTLTASERAFLHAAVDAREAERRADARAARRSRMLLTTLSAVLAVALVAGLAAWKQAGDNRRQRTETAARRIAAVADSLRTTDPRTALLLGVASWRVAPLSESRRALLGSLTQPEQDTFTDPAPGDGPRRFLADGGRTLLSVTDGHWTRWDVTSHRRTGTGGLPPGTPEAADPAGRVLALTTDDDDIRLWDTTTRGWTGGLLPAGLYSAEFTPDGRGYLLSAVEEDRVQLRSATDGRVRYEAVGAAGSPGAAVSEDGSLLATCPARGGSPEVLRIAGESPVGGDWEAAKDVCGERAMLRFGPGDRLASASEHDIRVWSTRTGRQLASLPEQGVEYASFSPAGDFLATADRSEVRVWRLSSPGTPVFRHALNNQHLYGGLAWDPARPVLRYLEGGTVHALDVTAATTARWRGTPTAGALLSPEGETLATAEREGAGYRFLLKPTEATEATEATEGTEGKGGVRTLPAPGLPVSRDPDLPVIPEDTLPLMAFTADGSTFAYGVSAPGRHAAPQRVTLWDVRKGRVRATPDLASGQDAGAVIGLTLSPDGRRLYLARMSTAGHVQDEVWDTTSGRRTAVRPDMTGVHLAVSPDGGLLVSDNGTLDISSGRAADRDLVRGEQIGALAFSANGERLAAGDMTGRVGLWDGELRHRSGVLRNVFPAPLGDTPEAVSALALSPDGHTLAVGGDAGTLQLWDTETQQPLGGPLPTAGEAIGSLAFAADGTTLYASGAHVVLQRYVIDAGRVAERVCARAGGTLTREEWRTYVWDAPYRRICGNVTAHSFE